MDETRNYMPVINTIVTHPSEDKTHKHILIIIMRSKYICGNNRRVVATVFFLVAAVHNIYETFGVGVTLVRSVRWTVVDHAFINGIRGFVRKDAS